MRALPLSPAEGFLFSRIDGVMSEPQLASATGLAPQAVAAAIDRLVQLRAIQLDGGAHGSTDRGRAATPPPPPAASRPPDPGSTPRPGRYGAAELEEDVEIDLERRRRILDLFARLDELTYYDVLGVDPQDDKKKVKAAYYAVAPEFHPDRFFRKQLGSYKPKIEAIFARLTLAQDVLTSRQRREEYDEYLTTIPRTRSHNAAPVHPAREASQAAAAAVPKTPPPPSAPEPTPQRASDPGRISEPSSPAEVARARREALARKLAAGRRPGAPGSSPAIPASRAPDPNSAQRAADALKARYDAAVSETKREQIRRYVTAGRTALEAKDFAAAANAFRMASSLAPEDAALAAETEETTRQAGVALADGYWKQGQFEESEGRWGDAALSYAKVCNGRPTDAKAHERVAFATLKSSTNVRRAVDFARKAVELDPRTPELRLTLARAYGAAGFLQSAKGEIARALELAPGDAKIAELCAKTREETQKLGKLG